MLMLGKSGDREALVYAAQIDIAGVTVSKTIEGCAVGSGRTESVDSVLLRAADRT